VGVKWREDVKIIGGVNCKTGKSHKSMPRTGVSESNLSPVKRIEGVSLREVGEEEVDKGEPEKMPLL